MPVQSGRVDLFVGVRARGFCVTEKENLTLQNGQEQMEPFS